MSKASVERARELYHKQFLLLRVGVDPGIVPQIQKQAEKLRTWFELRCGTEAGHIVFDESKGMWLRYYHPASPVYCRSVSCVEDQVREWLSKNLPKGVRVEFQPDPRGHSLYVYYGTGETEYVSFG